METKPTTDQRHRLTPTNDMMLRKLLTTEGHLTITKGFIKDFYGVDVDVKDIKVENPYIADICPQVRMGGNAMQTMLTHQVIRDIVLITPMADIVVELNPKLIGSHTRRARYYASERFSRQGDGDAHNVWSLDMTGEPLFEDDKAFRMGDLDNTSADAPLRLGFFELSKEPTEPHQRYWKQLFLTGQVPPEAPDYLHEAEKLMDNSKLTIQEIGLANLLAKAQADQDIMIEEAVLDATIMHALAALSMGLSAARVVQITGLSLEAVSKLDQHRRGSRAHKSS